MRITRRIIENARQIRLGGNCTLREFARDTGVNYHQLSREVSRRERELAGYPPKSGEDGPQTTNAA